MHTGSGFIPTYPAGSWTSSGGFKVTEAWCWQQVLNRWNFTSMSFLRFEGMVLRHRWSFTPTFQTRHVKKTTLRRISSSGTWRRVGLVWTDVSEERIASIFRVEKSASKEPAWAGGCRLSHGIFHSHRRETLKSYKLTLRLSLEPITKCCSREQDLGQ
jgi:hypothetical protein